jgi:hypothetical protein
LSISFSFFFHFSLNFLLNKKLKIDIHSHCAKYQNIVTLENERGALSSWKILNQLQWLGFGLLVNPWGFDRDQTLGLRSIIPLLAARCCQGQGEKQCFLATHLEYRAFHLRASCISR